MEALGINFGLLIVQIIAFIIVFLTLNSWVYKPMLDMMESRKQKIAQGLEDARVASEARANAEKDAQKILAEAQAEAGKVVREATERAASAGKDVKAAAEAEALAICADKLPLSPLPPPINSLAKHWM
jgi:F-type H+-transporting ATPase subunit b